MMVWVSRHGIGEWVPGTSLIFYVEPPHERAALQAKEPNEGEEVTILLTNWHSMVAVPRVKYRLDRPSRNRSCEIEGRLG